MTEITFSDILIEPQYSDVTSRSIVDLTSNMGTLNLKLPIISANMRHITGAKMATAMVINGGAGILHRFNDIKEGIKEYQESIKEIKDEPTKKNIGISIGVQETDRARFDMFYEKGARVFCIDVAHAHHFLVKKMIEWIRRGGERSNELTIIAGNIATSQAALDLQEWGADVLKVGLGPGSVCMTRKNTGVGVPQFSALQNIAKVASVPIIADGGIKSVGDISKALIFADAVMIGSFIAGTSETPGKVFRNEEGHFYKVYGGSAAGENKIANGDNPKFVEGIMKTVAFQGHVGHILREIRDGLQSAFSYTGAYNLKEFQSKVKWNLISGGSKAESKI